MEQTSMTVQSFNIEQSFIMVKPDGVRAGMIGDIIHEIESRYLVINDIKMEHKNVTFFRLFYPHIGRKIFVPMACFLTSGPVVGISFSGEAAVEEGVLIRNQGRQYKNPDSPSYENILHASDSVKSAKQDIELFFKDIL